MLIALVGNANCGKTSLFNTLTGASEYVGNRAGVTVEAAIKSLKSNKSIKIADLPGIYSLSPYSSEEKISTAFLLDKKADVIICVADASSPMRNLYLFSQLAELNVPIVLALNKCDIMRKRGGSVNENALSKALGVPVIVISAASGAGCERLIEAAKSAPVPTARKIFGTEIEALISNSSAQTRFKAVKALEQGKNTAVKRLEEKHGDEISAIIASMRYDFAEKAVEMCFKKPQNTSASTKIDKLLTGRLTAFPCFFAVIFLIYFLSVNVIGGLFANSIEALFESVLEPTAENLLKSSPDWLSGLICSGILGGLRAVVSFVPQLSALFYLLALLEECGYISRISFITDRAFKKLGMSGKSLVPLLLGSGCTVPAVMSARIISSENERKIAVISAPFIPCSAKLPVISLISAQFFGGSWWTAALFYLIGAFAASVSGLILGKLSLLRPKRHVSTLSELPDYRIPPLISPLKTAVIRTLSFLKRAGTVIVFASAAVWFLTGFGILGGSLCAVKSIDQSFLHDIGELIAPIFAPLGFGSWKAASATVLGLLAKEEIVGFFGVLKEVSGIGAEAVGSSLQALSFLIFNLFCVPCVSAVSAISKELASAKWTVFAFFYHTAFAYISSLFVYRYGLLFTEGIFNAQTVAAIILTAFALFLIFRRRKLLKAIDKMKKLHII